MLRWDSTKPFIPLSLIVMKFTLRFILLTIFFFVASKPADAQLLNDAASLKLIQKGLDHIYNYEYTEANVILNQVEKKYPNHPVSYILDSFVMYWQYLPIKDNPTKSKEYIAKLNQCLDAITKKYGKNSTDPEAVFYTIVARGYIAMMYNYNGELMSAAGEAKKAYNALTTGLKLTERNPEFYFTSGMYNYYVELYPEDHAMVKPLMIFFKNGNKALGLKQIDIATRHGVITRAEACFYLSHIYMEHETNFPKALTYSQKLADWYPKNQIFNMVNTEALLLTGKYYQAEKGMNMLKANTRGFYPIAYNTFQGIIYEKSAKNDSAAQRSYLTALKTPHDDQYTREYYAMSYSGLARIANRAGNKAKAREYYKKALEKAEYKSIVKEAKEFK
ncbi:ABC transporter substrate-binding protein [Dyadobacter sp. CY345]|uniref:tetratricopeptide repeat protein n=1 Tax=Dyadobacter sp. CY345 TaxID=2909335 RepID=UPI001F465105|nr:ABC transporter substrate-binding protein [Dyadobacter sp. CY345]MCF2442491.1 ABC transporter substrate-binding protein [Dyadobacter sp. CY345]